jgi:hypothetical protein
MHSPSMKRYVQLQRRALILARRYATKLRQAEELRAKVDQVLAEIGVRYPIPAARVFPVKNGHHQNGKPALSRRKRT